MQTHASIFTDFVRAVGARQVYTRAPTSVRAAARAETAFDA